jgi:hypothetical protein
MSTRLAALLILTVSLLGCDSVQGTLLVNPPSVYGWNAQIIQPASTTIVLAPGTTAIIIIQLVPVNGFVLPGNQFLNAFDGANPSLAFCPTIVSVINNGLIAPPNTFSNAPTIGLTLSPIGVGTCSMPLNLGLSGVTITINVLTSIAANRRLLNQRERNRNRGYSP